MDSRGVTLIELLVAVTIIMIVMIVVGFQFVGWQIRYGVESEMKQLVSDFMGARLHARQLNRSVFMVFDKSAESLRYQYIAYEDNGDGIFNPDIDTEIHNLTKRGLSYRLDWNEAEQDPPVGPRVVFGIDEKGFMCILEVDKGPDCDKFQPPPSTEKEVPDTMTMWIVDRDGRRFILDSTLGYAEREDIPEVAYDCAVLSQTRVNIGKLDIGGADKEACREK